MKFSFNGAGFPLLRYLSCSSTYLLRCPVSGETCVSSAKTFFVGVDPLVCFVEVLIEVPIVKLL